MIVVFFLQVIMLTRAVASPPPALLPLSLTFSLLMVCNFPGLAQTQDNKNTSDYELCSAFKCGNISFSFPFSALSGSGPIDCGPPGYQISCADGDISSTPSLLFSNRLYPVIALHPDPSARFVTVVDKDLIQDLKAGSCGNSLRNLTNNSPAKIPPLTLPSWAVNLTLFECPPQIPLSQEFLDKVVRNYSCDDVGSRLYLWLDESQFGPPSLKSVATTPDGCKLMMLPISSVASAFALLNGSKSSNRSRIELDDVLGDGFPLTWPVFGQCDSCNAQGRGCGFDRSLDRIVCLPNPRQKKSKKRKLIVIGVAIGSSTVFFIILILLLTFRSKRISLTFKTQKQNPGSEDTTINAESFIRAYRSELLTNYSYGDIKKITNGFNEKLGEGGYGNVYKGKLVDGRVVAVKLLEKTNNNGRDFINEVASIGRIHHVNIINLLGFSWNGSKQALIYEYMPNGSLGDLLSNQELSLSLGLARLLEIAIGIAHGIEYLHSGCESRILHLDIKPQNVLLDQNFNPKISDFGLAKVYSRSRSAVTIADARGTIGYIAPEVFMRNLGNVSTKSDVYSYGMLLLEMVGRRKHVEPNVSSSREAYFPGWIHDKLIEERDVELGDHSVVQEATYMVRKMAMVGLWCIQINPRRRPSMTRVVEMLSGDVDAIEMPPKPFFSLPRMQENEIDHDTTSIQSSSTNALSLISTCYEM